MVVQLMRQARHRDATVQHAKLGHRITETGALHGLAPPDGANRVGSRKLLEPPAQAVEAARATAPDAVAARENGDWAACAEAWAAAAPQQAVPWWRRGGEPAGQRWASAVRGRRRNRLEDLDASSRCRRDPMRRRCGAAAI